MRRLAFVLLVIAATAGPADGAIVTREDVAGRVITFDVPAGVDVNPYASALRRALHGDEIESLTIRFVSRATLTRSCGGGGVSCYRGRWRGGEIFLQPVEVARRSTRCCTNTRTISTPATGCRALGAGSPQRGAGGRRAESTDV